MIFMTDNMILEDLKSFLEQKVASKFKLQAAEENLNEYKLVNPAVFECYIPPNNFLPPELVSAVPCMLVGLEEGQDDGTEASLNIRITFVVYNPGEYANGKFTPNFQGYKDILNLITRTRMELAKAAVIGETSLRRPFKWGMYQDSPYPYWYGWLTFGAECASMEYIPDTVKNYL
jgi:hypothetical protein